MGSVRQKLLRKIREQNQMTKPRDNYAVIELNDVSIAGSFAVLSSLSSGYKVTIDRTTMKAVDAGYDWTNSVFEDDAFPDEQVDFSFSDLPTGDSANVERVCFPLNEQATAKAIENKRKAEQPAKDAADAAIVSSVRNGTFRRTAPKATIKAPTKVKDVPLVYPAIAQSARVQGEVLVEVIIGPDGRVLDAKVVSARPWVVGRNGKVTEGKVVNSMPLLDGAALDAVRQWVFTPALADGVAVSIIVTVAVTFRLQ